MRTQVNAENSLVRGPADGQDTRNQNSKGAPHMISSGNVTTGNMSNIRPPLNAPSQKDPKQQKSSIGIQTSIATTTIVTQGSTINLGTQTTLPQPLQPIVSQIGTGLPPVGVHGMQPNKPLNQPIGLLNQPLGSISTSIGGPLLPTTNLISQSSSLNQIPGPLSAMPGTLNPPPLGPLNQTGGLLNPTGTLNQISNNLNQNISSIGSQPFNLSGTSSFTSLSSTNLPTMGSLTNTTTLLTSQGSAFTSQLGQPSTNIMNPIATSFSQPMSNLLTNQNQPGLVNQQPKPLQNLPPQTTSSTLGGLSSLFGLPKKPGKFSF